MLGTQDSLYFSWFVPDLPQFFLPGAHFSIAENSVNVILRRWHGAVPKAVHQLLQRTVYVAGAPWQHHSSGLKLTKSLLLQPPRFKQPL